MKKIRAGNDYMTANNSQNYIYINFMNSNGGTKQCKALIQNNSSAKGKQYCVYQYTVGEDSFFDGNAYITTSITIPENIVYDNVGNANSSQNNVTLRRGGDLWNSSYHVDNNKIYIDTVKPNVVDAYVDIQDNFGYRKVDNNYYLKKSSQIRVGVTFSENVYEKDKSRK